MGKAHRPNANNYYKPLLKVAKAIGAICWWCGNPPRRTGWWELDHIVPTRIDSPLVVACSWCNRSRLNRLPHPLQLSRLYHSDKVVLSCQPADLIAWLTAEFGDDPDDIAAAIADTGEGVFFK